MKKAITTVVVALVAVGGANAGALFDDYLNYVRPGTGTGPGRAQLTATTAQSVGQSLTVPANTGEIYRIGIRAVQETWSPDETVAMTLYDSPEKKTRLGEYSIGQATSRVMDYKTGNGSEFRDSKDYVLYFQFRKLTEGKSTFYFELSVTGGDGKVSFLGFDSDAYAGGQCYPAGAVKDIAFECDIKPIADKQANLRKFFTERLDITRPELAAVKAAVDAGDWETAVEETVKHFHNRRDVWAASYSDLMTPKIDPKYDTATADVLMKGMVLNADTKQPIPWRKESWWAPVVTGVKQASHSIEPSPFLWHFDRALAGAYTATAKDEYARKAIDLRVQFILDNPNPKVVYQSTDNLKWYFELWNDRTAGARAPGHGELVYARLYNYPGWTTDEKMLFFCFIEDNARWNYKATSGGNWGMEAARCPLDFGVTFPEWKMSPEYIRWGAERMAELSMETVRGDGTSEEAAIKYHAMVARRFLGFLELDLEGKVQMDSETRAKVLKTINGMYDHMAYTEQPNNYVVMCGDSWYENHVEDAALTLNSGMGSRIPARFADMKSLASRIKNGADPVSKLLSGRFDAEAIALLKAYDGRSEPSDQLAKAVVAQLNKAIKSGPIYDKAAFAGVKLRDRTRRMLELSPAGDELEMLNKWLIEDAYPTEINKSFHYGELYKAAVLLDRKDIAWIASQGETGTPPTPISKVYPEAGYFIMRSDFGGPGRTYLDSRQMFIHNGGWFGAHGHWDLTSLNLYGYGRTLIIDPGQYAYVPPAGFDTYWNSSIHSMLVPEGRNATRDPGPSLWASNTTLDYFDGKHFGFNGMDGTDYVRRKVAFVKPDYFLVDDSAKATKNTEWAQVWNLTDPQTKSDPAAGSLETTFASGGNVLVLNQDPSKIEVTQAPGMTASGQYEKTAIFRLKQKTDNPRFQTLVYPYDAGKRPDLKWERLLPETPGLGDLFYSVRVSSGPSIDWVVFGECGRPAAYRSGSHRVDADFAVVKLDSKGSPKSFAWGFGKEITFGGKLLARSSRSVASLSVAYSGSKLVIEAGDPDSALAVRTGGAKAIELNGKPLARPIIRDGVVYPFGDALRDIIADDRDSWEIVKISKYTKQITDTEAWGNQYTYDETDVGAREQGNFVFQVPADRTYRVEVFLPRITSHATDRAEYRVNAAMGKPVEPDGAVLGVRREGDTFVFTVNQQAMSGWVTLGDFPLTRGVFKLNAMNVTQTDGLNFIADAARLVER